MNSGKQKRGVLGDLTSRLGTEFAEVDAGLAQLPTPSPARARSAPGHLLEFTGVSQELRDAQQKIEELRKEKASGFEVELTALRASPYHIGDIVESRVAALVENLRQNPLNSPVVVRATADEGVYELLAGRHRTEAFRRLGRPTIHAVLRVISDDEAERVVFYDNLFAPSLSDYEKYLGFSSRQKSKSLTLEKLAEEGGISTSHVHRFMAFDKLPAAAQSVIRTNPSAEGLGAKLWGELAPLAAQYSERVVEAVQRVAAGRLAASAAGAWVTASEKAARQQPERVLVKRGRHKFAEVRARGTQWVVNFASEADAQTYGKKLLELVQSASAEER